MRSHLHAQAWFLTFVHDVLVILIVFAHSAVYCKRIIELCFSVDAWISEHLVEFAILSIEETCKLAPCHILLWNDRVFDLNGRARIAFWTCWLVAIVLLSVCFLTPRICSAIEDCVFWIVCWLQLFVWLLALLDSFVAGCKLCNYELFAGCNCQVACCICYEFVDLAIVIFCCMQSALCSVFARASCAFSFAVAVLYLICIRAASRTQDGGGEVRLAGRSARVAACPLQV